MDCENCKHINSENQNYCEVCGFPILKDKAEKFSYQQNRIEVEYKIKEFKKIRESILSFSIYALILATVVFLYHFIQSSNNFYSTYVFLLISLIYFGIYKFRTKLKGNLVFTLIVLSFYIVHTYFEFINQFDPREALSLYSFKRTGHLHFITILADSFHHLYYIMRLLIIVYFIKAFRIMYFFNRHKRLYTYVQNNEMV